MEDLKDVLGGDAAGMGMEEMDFKKPEIGEKRDVSVSRDHTPSCRPTEGSGTPPLTQLCTSDSTFFNLPPFIPQFSA
jgi:hypothetical protein